MEKARGYIPFNIPGLHFQGKIGNLISVVKDLTSTGDQSAELSSVLGCSFNRFIPLCCCQRFSAALLVMISYFVLITLGFGDFFYEQFHQAGTWSSSSLTLNNSLIKVRVRGLPKNYNCWLKKKEH